MKTNFLITLILLGIFSSLNFAQAPDVLWTKTFGGTGIDIGRSVKQCSDSGYIVTGFTTSYGAGGHDVWLLRTDPLGNILWTKTFGGTDLDEATSVWQNTDGGFIITGQTRSFNADSADILLIRTDSLGNPIWIKNYGGSGFQSGTSVQQTSDGGFIVTGYTSDSPGQADAFLLLTNSSGNSVQFKIFNRSNYDYGQSVIQLANGGYAITGMTADSSIQYDVWLICTDASGNPYCNQTYGGSESEYGYSIQQATDGGFIIAGTTYSFGNPGADFWLIRTDSSGDTLWTKPFGGTGTELGNSVLQTVDEGFIIAGYTSSFGSGSEDIWVIKTDASGDTVWTKTIGGTSGEISYSIRQTSDEGYIVTGYTNSFGSGGADIWLVRLDADPNPTHTEIEQDFNPSAFQLFQNYPNPFNPSTKIRFMISDFGFTNLKIYDILGNEVATLVNEYKPAGNYEVEFNAGSLPSGIYFYQLKSGNLIQTKKLILIK